MSRARTHRRRAWLPVAAAGIVVSAVTLNALVSHELSSATDASTTLFGEGGSFAEPMINKLQADAASTIAPLVPAYFDANIDQGRDDFASGVADYAVSEVPLTATEATTAAQNGRSFAYVPFAASAIAIGAVILCSNDSSLTPTTLCPNLQMTVPQLAEVFTSTADEWTEPVFAQSQGGSPITPIDASRSISPIHEVDPTALNLGLQTLFLNNTVAKPIWESFLTLNKISSDTPTEHWPTGGGATGGDEQVADDLVPVNETDGVAQSNPSLWGQGAIAPLPVDWLGLPRNIPTFKIMNAAGAYVGPTAAAMTAAENHITFDPATNLVTFGFSATDTAAYPIPAMSYLIVPTSGLSQAKATALAAFIRFVLGSQGQADVEALGAAPVTPAMVAAGLQVAGTVATQSGTGMSASTTGTTSPAVAAEAETGATSQSGSSTDLTAETETEPTLAATGGVPWSLVIAGALLAAVGSVFRRLARRGARVSGADR